MGKRHRDLIVTEKASQASTIAKILGGRKVRRIQKNPPVYYFSLGDREVFITSARGHILETEFEDKYRKMPRVKGRYKELLTDARVIKIPRDGSRNIIKTIVSLAKRADRLIIATDYDREGENIGRQIVNIAKRANKRLVIKRARFSSLAPSEIVKAFDEKNLKDINMNLVEASEVRQEIDLRMGVALTRLFSGNVQRLLGKRGIVISLGPVQTPTLGFIVERYLKHLESKEKAKPRYVIVASTDIGELTIEKTREKKEEAERLIDKLPEEIELERMQKKDLEKRQPLPLNTPRLAELAARYLGISSKRTLSIAEELYLNAYISYPRTETDKRSKDALSQAFPIAKKAAKLLKASREPGMPRSGKRDDKAHPPIHPVRVVEPKKLPEDIGRLYELILRHFLANFGPSAKIRKLSVAYSAEDRKFSKLYEYPISSGRLEVYPYIRYNDRPVEIPKRLRVRKYYVKALPPKIIQPLTEAELVSLMDAHGVGTDATFAEHIAKLIERNYVKRKGKYLIPTELGLKLYMSLVKLEPELVKPDIRKFMEDTFKAVERGSLTREEALRVNLEKTVRVFDKLEKNISKIAQELKDLAKEQKKKRSKK